MKKVNFLCLIALGMFFSACHSDDDTWGDWAKSDEFPGDYRVLATSFQYGETAYVGMGYNQQLSTQDKFLRNFYKFENGRWTSVGNFPVEGRKGAVSFVIGDTAFVGAGFRDRSSSRDRDRYYSDFYKFNLKTGQWIKNGDEYAKTDIKDFVKEAGGDTVACSFWGGIGFELNGKGYVGTGRLDGRVSKTLYEYDPATGKWTEMTMPGDARVGGVVFKLQGKAVICLGSNGNSNVVDVYTFDGTNWERKRPLQDLDGSWNDDYGKIPRSYAMAFTSNLDGVKGYVCGGVGTKTAWEYRLDEDRWYEVTEFPDAMLVRVAGVAFTVNGYGYVTTGGSSIEQANDNSTWRFIPGVDEDENNDY